MCKDSPSIFMSLTIEEVDDSKFCEVGEFEVDGECYQWYFFWFNLVL